MAFSVYSLSDVKVTFNYGGKNNVLSNMGSGRISISFAGDMSSITNTATGYVVVNKLVSKNGSVGLEIPVNSQADGILRRWINDLRSCATNQYATATLTLTDSAAGRTLTMTGVVPQKMPDEAYDQTSGNRQYQLLFAEMTIK